jgi:hypothetical protein
MEAESEADTVEASNSEEVMLERVVRGALVAS